MQYRKKPVKIEAFQFGSHTDIAAEFRNLGCPPIVRDAGKNTGWYVNPDDGALMIRTLEGDMRVPFGHWIIRGVKGEFYACAPDIFAMTYEPAADDGDADDWARKLAEVTDAMRNLWAQSHSLMTDLENLATETCNLHETLLKLQAVIATTTPPWETNQ